MTKDQIESLRSGVTASFISPNVSDSNGEPANVVDAIANLANGVWSLREGVTPRDAAPGRDARGGYVSSLTEATIGISEGLFAIAEALGRIAEAMEVDVTAQHTH